MLNPKELIIKATTAYYPSKMQINFGELVVLLGHFCKPQYMTQIQTSIHHQTNNKKISYQYKDGVTISKDRNIESPI